MPPLNLGSSRVLDVVHRFLPTLAVAVALALGVSLLTAPAGALASGPESGPTKGPLLPSEPGPDLVPGEVGEVEGAVATVLEDAEAALAGEGVADERDVTMVLRDLWAARPRMTRAERRAADRLLARPTADGGDPYAEYQSGTTPARVCSETFPLCVTYVTTSRDRATPAWAQRTLGTFEDAWRTIVGSPGLGYPAPAPDGDAGGDSRFDVYLADISSNGLYGYCVPEAAVPGEPSLAQSYCVLDNDMAGFTMAPQASLAVTAAHEFFHAVQFNLDAREDMWFLEATATWMEEQVADSINDNRQFLRSGQLGRPYVPLDTYGQDTAMYGNWIFIQYIAQRFGVDAIRRIWMRLSSRRGSPNQWSLQGVDSYVRDQGGNWGTFYLRFVQANLRPKRFYEEGRHYKPASFRERVVLRPRRTVKVRNRVAHLSSHSTVFRPHKSIRGQRHQRLRVQVRATRPLATPRAVLHVYRRSGKVVRLPVALNRKGRGARTVAFAPGRVRRVVLTTVNASLRYERCGQGTTWACGGRPRDDTQRFIVTARVRR